MQQTEHYSLNLIETSDTFTPQPLNENTQALDAKLADLDTQAGSLNSRVSVLEQVRMVNGTYRGNWKDRVVSVGFTPRVVWIGGTMMTSDTRIIVDEHVCAYITNGGFFLGSYGGNSLNNSSRTYQYVARRW